MSLLPSGRISQELIAENPQRSVSALQRQLRTEGVSLKSILDDTRAELAQPLVRHVTERVS